MKIILIFIFLNWTCLTVNAEEQVGIEIVKASDGVWTLNYTADHYIEKLGFRRNPDNSRIGRWLPVSDEFEIIYREDKESIAKIVS